MNIPQVEQKKIVIAFDEGERKHNFGLWFSIAGVLCTVIGRKIPHSLHSCKVTKMCPPCRGCEFITTSDLVFALGSSFSFRFRTRIAPSVVFGH